MSGNKDMSDVPANQQELREMVYHTDARVTAMEGSLSSLAANQQRTESKIDQVITTLTQPKNVNWAAWVGICISVLVTLVAGTIGFTQYISLTQEPIKKEVEYNRDQTNDARRFQREAHYEFGVTHKNQEVVTREIDKLWEHVHNLEDRDEVLTDRIAENALKAAEAKVSRRAMGDYMQEKSNEVEHLKETVRVFQSEAQYVHGQRQGLDKQVQQIDNQGSRVWNKVNKEATQ